MLRTSRDRELDHNLYIACGNSAEWFIIQVLLAVTQWSHVFHRFCIKVKEIAPKSLLALLKSCASYPFISRRANAAIHLYCNPLPKHALKTPNTFTHHEPNKRFVSFHYTAWFSICLQLFYNRLIRTESRRHNWEIASETEVVKLSECFSKFAMNWKIRKCKIKDFWTIQCC